jgi:HK97 family phage prohead protease
MQSPVIKTTVAPVKDSTFTMSDETEDRYGDIISADGWELQSFRANPVALFGHDHGFPIGTWTDVHIDKKTKSLRGKLDIERGASSRIDEIGRLVEAGVLKAVSVGFRPTKSPEPLKDKDGKETYGVRFVGQELLECSVVPIPANPNALALAKSFHTSPDTMRLVFAESGDQRQPQQRRVITGEFAAIPLVTRHKPMPSTFDQRIEARQTLINQTRDEIEEITGAMDDSSPDDSQTERLVEATERLARHERALAALTAAQRAQAPTDDNAEQPGRELVPVRGRAASLAPASEISVQRADGSTRRVGVPVWATPKKKEMDALDYIIRNAVILLHAHRLRKTVDEARVHCYGNDEPTRVMFNLVQRAPTMPAMTDVPGWAEELVTPKQGDFMFPLMPDAIFPKLSARGMSLDFGRFGRINIPTRLRTTTVAGSFVGEGQQIPVRQALFAAQIVTPKKLGVITVMTREIEEHSIPAIEGLLRRAIMEDTGESIDNILLDANPATVVRPPGILNGITALPPTTQAAETSGFYRMVRDIRRLKAGLIGPTNDNVRSPCWIMNPIREDAIALNPAPGTGLFPFRDEVRAGMLEGWPVYESTTVNPNTIIVMDAADFITAGQGAPTFEVSDQAVLHMEDTDPSNITGETTPPHTSPAVPVRSMWQTDSYALRLLYRVNWLLYRPMVAWMQGFNWGSLDATTVGLIGGENGNGQGQVYAEPTYQEPAYQR